MINYIEVCKHFPVICFVCRQTNKNYIMWFLMNEHLFDKEIPTNPVFSRCDSIMFVSQLYAFEIILKLHIYKNNILIHNEIVRNYLIIDVQYSWIFIENNANQSYIIKHKMIQLYYKLYSTLIKIYFAVLTTKQVIFHKMTFRTIENIETYHHALLK